MSHPLSIGWKQSGLLHGNQHQASPWWGHTRLTREKHTENVKRMTDVLDKSNRYHVKLCLLLNPRLVERNTSTEIIKMPCHVSPNAVGVQWFPGEGKGSPASSVFHSLDVHSQKTVSIYHPHIRGLFTSLLPPGYMARLHFLGFPADMWSMWLRLANRMCVKVTPATFRPGPEKPPVQSLVFSFISLQVWVKLPDRRSLGPQDSA